MRHATVITVTVRLAFVPYLLSPAGQAEIAEITPLRPDSRLSTGRESTATAQLDQREQLAQITTPLPCVAAEKD
jgi:hypothetical protein